MSETGTEIEPQTLDVIAIAPHPDDLEIICGGTLAALSEQGHKVGMFDLTSGEPTPRGTLEIRKKEAEEARKILGVALRVNLELPNRVLMDSPENRYVIATAFRKYRPKVVITMAGRTPAASPDHYQGQMLAEASRFYSQLTKWNDRFGGTEAYRVPHLVYAPVPFDAEDRHYPGSFVMDISNQIEKKMEAIRCYESQFDAARFKKTAHFIRSTNGFYGGRCGFAYGELFCLPTLLGTSNFLGLVQGGHATASPVVLPGKEHLPLG